MKAVYGYRIYTETTENSNAIGLYSGQIRWLESDLSGLAEPWKTILVSGISAATDDGLDTRQGGGVAEVGGFDLVVDNTTQIAQRLETLGIILTGKRCEKIRIDPGSMREYVEFTGYCEDIKWNEREMMIPVQDCRLKRDAVLATMISAENRPNASADILGSVIPVTYGEIDKAKMVRTANKKITFENPAYGHYQNVSLAFGFAYTIIGTPMYPYGLSVFPVVGKGVSPTREYKIQLAGSDVSVQWTRNGAPVTSGTVWLTNLNGRYLHGVSGDGSGQYRRIEVAWCNLDVGTYIKPITVIVSDFFEDEPIGNATGDETHNVDGDSGTNSWVQIVDIKREYESDVVTLKDFLDPNGVVVTAPIPLSLFSFEQPKSVNVETLNTSVAVISKPLGFYQLPEYAYAEKTTVDKNSIIIDAKLFQSSPDQMNAFTILPVSLIEAVTDSDLGYFDVAGSGFWNGMHPATAASNLIGGYYYKKDLNGTAAALRGTTTKSGALADIIDRNRATYFEHNQHFPANTNMNQHAKYAHVIRFRLPVLDGSFEWDDCFFLVDMNWTPNFDVYGPLDPRTWIRYRRFLGKSVDMFEDGDSIIDFQYPNGMTVEPSNMKDVPDFYYGAVVDNNKSFYFKSGLTSVNRWGYSKFKIAGIDTDDMFNSIRDVTLATLAKCDNEIIGATLAFDDNLKIFEAGVLFRKSVSIQEAIYTGVRGRIRGTAWRAGRPATDLLDDSIDIAEDLLRRQNWSETGDTQSPGIEQAPHARINTKTTHGGFESTALDNPRGIPAARQVLEYDASRVSELMHSLCREFFLVQYRESTGSECITYFPERDTEAPVRRITLSDVPAGVDIPDVQAPSPADVFCYDLNLKYKRNYASDGFDGLINVMHTDASVYDPDYVTGYDGGYKQAIWERAHQLYIKYRRQEKPPAELVELEWHRTVDGAAWYLRNLLNWSDKQRLSLPVLDEVARKIPKFSRITLNLPHHTDGVDVVCFVERIKRNPKSGISELSLVLYDDVDWSGGGVSLSDSSASDSASSTSDTSASTSSSSFSGLSKSVSSDSTSYSSQSSESSASGSLSSTIEITDDHQHTKIVNPDTGFAGLEIVTGNEIEVGADLKQVPANQQQGAEARIVVLNKQVPIPRLAIANGDQTRWMIRAQKDNLDLTAIAALTGTGIACRTAAVTWSLRNLASGNTGIVVTNPAGVAGNPTVTLNATLINGSIVDSLHHHAVLYQSDNGAAAISADAAGNIGIGTTAKAWNAEDTGIDIGAYGCISSFASYNTIFSCLRLGENIYRDVAGNWKIKTNGCAALLLIEHDSIYMKCDGPIARLAGETSTLVDIMSVGPGGVHVNGLADAAIGYVKSSTAGILSRQTGVPWADVTSRATTLAGYGITDAQPAAHGGTTGKIVKFGVNSLVDSLIVENATGIGINVSATRLFHVEKNQDASTDFVLKNTNNHTKSYVQVAAISDGVNELDLIAGSTLCTALDSIAAGTLGAGKSILYSGNVNGLLINNYANTPLYLATNNVVRMTIAAAGLVTIPNGINLGDTSLTKYKEATFTVRMTDESNNTIATGTAKYIIAGNLVTLTIPTLVGNIPDAMYLKDIPTEIAPASDVDCPIWVRNGNANFMGSLHMRYSTVWWAGVGYPAGNCYGNTAGIPGPQSISYIL